MTANASVATVSSMAHPYSYQQMSLVSYHSANIMNTLTTKHQSNEYRPTKKRRDESSSLSLCEHHDPVACDQRILELTKLVHHQERKSRGTLGGLSRTLGALMSENRTLKQLHQDLAWRCELARIDGTGSSPNTRLRLEKEKPQGPGLFARRFERLVRRVDALNHDFQERYAANWETASAIDPRVE